MRFATVGPLVVAMLVVTGCAQRADESGHAVVGRSPASVAGVSKAVAAYTGSPAAELAADASDSAAPFAAANAADSLPSSMLIRTGDASIEVDSLDTGIAAVQALARRLGGYVANTSLQAGRQQTRSATLQLKIPAARFDEALTALDPIGKVESTNVTAEDVGEEYVDVNARMANGRRLEQRLIDLLATRTGKLSDVLAVERELARVRGEIERQEGRLRYLRAHVAMSTLSVTVHEPVPILGEQVSSGVLAQAFRQAWRNFVGFIAGFIAALGTLVPLAVVLGAIVYGVVKGARKVKRPAVTGTGGAAA